VDALDPSLRAESAYFHRCAFIGVQASMTGLNEMEVYRELQKKLS
jgi:hypothetical protein